ncbi:hypothetical protein [Methanolobus halotolerans]|uniref:hypothetical protein n=1 Tax=Methanolobus halotolerans TaxID=2052935 RepID=UPI0014369D1C|nr:hypothetical protein [Methanolobus halotolerans]
MRTDNYRELIVKEMKPVLATINVFDVNSGYWGARKPDFIPPHLLRRINERGIAKS